jgi:hypothetical protein
MTSINSTMKYVCSSSIPISLCDKFGIYSSFCVPGMVQRRSAVSQSAGMPASDRFHIVTGSERPDLARVSDGKCERALHGPALPERQTQHVHRADPDDAATHTQDMVAFTRVSSLWVGSWRTRHPLQFRQNDLLRIPGKAAASLSMLQQEQLFDRDW